MLLTMDVGNSNVSCAVFEGDSIPIAWKMPTRQDRDAREYAAVVRSELARGHIASSQVNDIVIGSVVRIVVEKLSDVCRILFDREPVVASTRLDLGIRVAWEHPETVGIDRLASATAAYHRHRHAAIVVDVGTAITVDAVSSEGTYLGGAIAPGLRLALKALSQGTNLLPDVALVSPEHAIGTSTPECLLSGVVYGSAGLADALVRGMNATLGGEARIIGTGGDIDRIAPISETIEEVDPYLVLRGLRIICERNR